MRWIRILGIILGSVWFFPVSCTTGLYAGTLLISQYDFRDAEKGDSLHSHFSVVAEPGNDGKPFRVMSENDIALHMEDQKDMINLYESMSVLGMKPRQSFSFLMSQPEAKMDWFDSTYSYRVLEDTGSEQLIEVVETYHDSDNTIRSRYKATESTITPISSKMLYFGYMFGAAPYAFGFSLILYTLGRLLHSRSRTPPLGKEYS